MYEAYLIRIHVWRIKTRGIEISAFYLKPQYEGILELRLSYHHFCGVLGVDFFLVFAAVEISKQVLIWYIAHIGSRSQIQLSLLLAKHLTKKQAKNWAKRKD